MGVLRRVFPPMAFIHALLLAPFNYQSADHQRKQAVELLERVAVAQVDILKALQENNRDENAGVLPTSDGRV